MYLRHDAYQIPNLVESRAGVAIVPYPQVIYATEYVALEVFVKLMEL